MTHKAVQPACSNAAECRQEVIAAPQCERRASRAGKPYEDQAIRKSSHAPEKKQDPGELARINFKHGKDMFDKGRIGEAITFLQNACDQDPSKAEHFHCLAIAQGKNPRWKKDAEENFLKAIEKDPMNAEMYAHLGSLYARGGLHSKARDMFKKALQWDPANQEAQEGLAQEEGGRKGLLGMFKK